MGSALEVSVRPGAGRQSSSPVADAQLLGALCCRRYIVAGHAASLLPANERIKTSKAFFNKLFGCLRLGVTT